MALPRRWISRGTSSAPMLRLGMSRSSASSTTAVLITTPGETPIPFLISMEGYFEFWIADFGLKDGNALSLFNPKSAIQNSKSRSLFSKFALEQFRQRVDGL